MMNLVSALLELYRQTSTDLPQDVEIALRKARAAEHSDSAAAFALNSILESSKISGESLAPLCQDTGFPTFFVSYNPKKFSQKKLTHAIKKATVLATKKFFLRPNCVDPLTQKNCETNFLDGYPEIHFNEWTKSCLEISLLLKGGGSENVSCQYSLPSPPLNAGRDLNGVRKCVLDTLFKAQGLGCPPYLVGVGIGGSRSESSLLAKKQLLRRISDKAKNTKLAMLEKRLLDEANSLDIGAMGFGGKTTVLAVKAASLPRIPASFFVSVSLCCWALRRRKLTFSGGKASYV